MKRPQPSPEQDALVKTIGRRMREAREMCNLSQSAAARRLGYANSSKLSKVEGATDTKSVPLWLICRAASVYEVSVDFLFGHSDDWETGPRMTQQRESSAWLFDAWEKARRRDMETLQRLHSKVEGIASALELTASASSDLSSAFDRFVQLNTEFQDMRAGAPLAASIERQVDASRHARCVMKKLKTECRLAASGTSQLSLLIFEE